MDVALQRMLLGRDGRSQMLTGLRGVGKTVLLDEFEQIGPARGLFHAHIEVSEDGQLSPALVAALRRVLLAMDAKRRIGERVRRVLGVLEAFSLRLPDGAQIHIDVEAVAGPGESGHLPSDLAALFVELGQVAADHDSGALLTIDELHYVDVPTLSALIVGLHRATQLRLPVTVAGAGLPSLAAVTGNAKTYAERMFGFSQVGSLPVDLAAEALFLPAADEGVAWDARALEAVCRVTACYPYFIQQPAKVAGTWLAAQTPSPPATSAGPSP